MNTITRALCAGMFASAVWSASAAAPPPVEAFGNLPAIADVHLSPDGTHFSAIEPVNGRPAVLVFELHPQPGAKPLVYSLEDGNAVDSMWVTNDRLVCIYYENKYLGGSTGVNLAEIARAVSISISGKRPLMLMKGTPMYLENSTTNVLGRSADNPNIIYMAAYRANSTGGMDTRFSNGQWRLNLYSVNVDDNTVDSVESGNIHTAQWIVDQHGHALARVDSTGETEQPKSKDTFVVNDAGSWREAAAYDNFAGSVASIDGITFDGTGVVVERWSDDGKRILESLPLKAGEKPAVLFSDAGYDLENALRDEWTGRIIGASFIDDKEVFRYFDPALAHIQKRLEAALPGQTVQISTWDQGRTIFLVTAQDPHNPPGIYLFTPAKGTLEYLMSAYPGLQATDLGDMKPYSYKARDGLDIHAYLTLPPGRDPKMLPTVVFPHGGPDDRDSIRFDWWAQFMASRGYAVLQPNFRGSTGYGEAFRNAGYGQWGRKMQDDVSDGVKKLVADGIADPKRICIVGASYGGYSALAGATFSPDLYACAVSYAGIADVSEIIGQAAGGTGERSPAVRFWEARLGNRYEDEKALRDASPALHADQVRAPILLLHNDADITVPYTQSVREQTALQAVGRHVELVILKGDDHYLNHTAARVRVLQEIERFLAANIGN